MLGNLTAILIFEKDVDDDLCEKYVFNHEISTFLDVMKQSENKLVRKNGVRALAIFYKKLDWIPIDRKLFVKLTELLRDVILFDSDVDNILNSLNVLTENFRFTDEVFLKNEGFLVQLLSLLRFFIHRKNNRNILQEGGKYKDNSKGSYSY